MGAQMYELLALSVTAGFLAVIVGSDAETRGAWLLGALMKLASIGLFAAFVGLHASRETGPFSPGLNFAVTAALTALGGWHGWAFLEDTDAEGDVEDEAEQDDADWF